MATSAPNTTPDPRPTGDLEHLFRQKFADAEVTPRASLWEQLDHELLVDQNNTYRHRLRVHRWVAAACLLLLLSVSGWALLHEWQPAAPGLAVQRGTGADSHTGVAANGLSGTASGSAATAAGTASAASNNTEDAADASTGAAKELLASENHLPMPAAEQGVVASDASQTAGLVAAPQAATGRSVGSNVYSVGTMPAAMGVAGSYYSANGSRPSGQAGFPAATSYSGMETETATVGWNGVSPRFASLRGGWLGSRPDTLKRSLLSAPQPAIGTLAAAQDQTKTAAKQWRRLRLGGSYAVGAYNPNINFSDDNGMVQADRVANALRSYYQEDAEAEYRRNLRAGLSQRVALTAAYTLNKRLTLVSGVEAAQQHATSATSYDFLDGRQVSRGVADLFNNTSYSYVLSNRAAAPASTRKTAYRYRSVAVPVALRYGSQRTGVSLYAKMGAAVGLLLNSNSKFVEPSVRVANSPASFAPASADASRAYSVGSSDSPYRKVQASVRGGAGIRYQPANANWSMVVGPTAEMGLTTLNANPSQRGLSQSRPHSVGVEAVVEFGRPKPMPVAQ
ncbi:outer membrane beta-barrel protein [Hymenobacter tibetensis]|uniref:Outer membrane beta-barrel protein n=1 Tax=Hymenobacter tibetensis TaxID=497967 RepID=A0ABY4CW98_9BACT|nr:outer membrane beta-barrel protein [Hymenobacter tibetensis]UOG74371.1 outer membrane beta-barrel protein [Hymenobacter tibetensis]